MVGPSIIFCYSSAKFTEGKGEHIIAEFSPQIIIKFRNCRCQLIHELGVGSVLIFMGIEAIKRNHVHFCAQAAFYQFCHYGQLLTQGIVGIYYSIAACLVSIADRRGVLIGNIEHGSQKAYLVTVVTIIWQRLGVVIKPFFCYFDQLIRSVEIDSKINAIRIVEGDVATTVDLDGPRYFRQIFQIVGLLVKQVSGKPARFIFDAFNFWFR